MIPTNPRPRKATSIYNTPRTLNRGRGRGRGGFPNSPMHIQQQGGTSSPSMSYQPPQSHVQGHPQQKPPIPYNEFQLKSCARHGKNHLMDFNAPRAIDFQKFAQPVKLQRKDEQQRQLQKLNGTADANGMYTPPTQYGPRTGADTSLIAPMGGALLAKKHLFKKKIKPINLSFEEQKRRTEEEKSPWVLEDYEGQNSFMGSLEGGNRSNYVFFVVTENGYKVVPVDHWYKFQAKRSVQSLSLDDVESEMKTSQRQFPGKIPKFMRENIEQDMKKEKELKSNIRDRRVNKNLDIKTYDDLEFEEEFDDDEEGVGDFEAEDEDTKDSKERIKRSYKHRGVEDFDDEEEEGDGKKTLDEDGKETMKILKRNPNDVAAYGSDDDSDMSGDEEAEKEETDEESTLEGDKAVKKTLSLTPRKNTPPHSSMGRKLHPPKLKREPLSRPILGRPRSPLVQEVKRDPSPGTASSSPDLSPGLRKRGMEDSPQETKHRRKHPPVSPQTPSSATSTPPNSAGGSDKDLITEAEVIDTLRGKKMTTKEFLLCFKKKIKKNKQNQAIISTLLKKVARHTMGDDNTTRILELKPELA